MKSEPPRAQHDKDPSDDVRSELLRWAQRETTYSIRGYEYERIPFGHELASHLAQTASCHDCGAMAGELHVPTCCWEECPRCGGHAASCQCWAD
jgi:hypothetical protein